MLLVVVRIAIAASGRRPVSGHGLRRPRSTRCSLRLGGFLLRDLRRVVFVDVRARVRAGSSSNDQAARQGVPLIKPCGFCGGVSARVSFDLRRGGLPLLTHEPAAHVR